MHLRPATSHDAAAWVEVVRACAPLMVLDTLSESHEMATEAASVVRWVAEVEGEVVGVARLRPYDAEHAGMLVMVHPGHRRRGVGTALLDRQLDLLVRSGAPRVTAVVEDDDASRAACRRWGFALARPLRMAEVDPRTVAEPRTAPSGTRVVPVAAVGPEPVWRAHQRVAGDDPSGLTVPAPYAAWRASEWDDPRARPDLGRAVLGADGELAAYSLLGCAGDRAWSAMTGTLPEHRGRGLALLAKQHALRAAAAAGITRATTGNDEANAPMLAVNRRLGYRPVASPWLAERTLTPAGPPGAP